MLFSGYRKSQRNSFCISNFRRGRNVVSIISRSERKSQQNRKPRTSKLIGGLVEQGPTGRITKATRQSSEWSNWFQWKADGVGEAHGADDKKCEDNHWTTSRNERWSDFFRICYENVHSRNYLRLAKFLLGLPERGKWFSGRLTQNSTGQLGHSLFKDCQSEKSRIPSTTLKPK